jgi:hypothetical protein
MMCSRSCVAPSRRLDPAAIPEQRRRGSAPPVGSLRRLDPKNPSALNGMGTGFSSSVGSTKRPDILLPVPSSLVLSTASHLLGLVAGTLVCFMGMTFAAVAGTGSDATRVCRLRSMWWAKAQEDAGPMPKPTLEPASPLCRLHRFP